MSERSVQIQTQGPLNANTSSFNDVSFRTSSDDVVPKPRFADFTCSYAEASLCSCTAYIRLWKADFIRCSNTS